LQDEEFDLQSAKETTADPSASLGMTIHSYAMRGFAALVDFPNNRWIFAGDKSPAYQFVPFKTDR
jgi:hypothetical protein